LKNVYNRIIFVLYNGKIERAIMFNYTDASVYTKRSSYDEGLRSYMIKVYGYMSLALIITFVVGAICLMFEPITRILYNIDSNGHITGITGIGMVLSFAPLAVVYFFSASLNNVKADLGKTQMWFWIYAALMGVSLSYVGLVYTGHSITRVFLITSSVFATMSLYGYTTKKDLTSIGSFLFMGLIGLIISSIVNIFLGSSALDFAISFIGVGIFMGMTAWDTQKIKSLYYAVGGGELGKKMAVAGALNLYMDFINLFLYMLKFLGGKRD
jgi:FtsH-binding integral membrane protein